MTKDKVIEKCKNLLLDLSSVTKAEHVESKVSNITDTFYLSYNNEGLVSIETMYDIGKKYFTVITHQELLYRRFNTNQKNNKKKVYELLFKFQK